MSRIVKKMKIMQPGGTLSDYVPIGAEAENINVDGESVETKLNKKPYYYDTVADMKADTKLKAEDMAVTLGYYSIDDGGAGEYQIIEDSGYDEADNGSLHELNNGLLAKLIVKNGEVNIKQFGAYGDGVHNDTLAIQTAIDKNKVIFINEGTYIINNTLTIDSSTVLYGIRNESVIEYTGTGTAINIIGKYNTLSNFKLIADTSISSSTKIGINMNKTKGQAVSGATLREIVISGVWVKDFNYAGITLNNVWHIAITQCRIDGNAPDRTQEYDSYGILFEYDGVAQQSWASSGCIFKDLYISGCSNALYFKGAWDQLIENCIIEYNYRPITRIASGNILICTNCWFENNTAPALIKGGTIVNGGRFNLEDFKSEDGLISFYNQNGFFQKINDSIIQRIGGDKNPTICSGVATSVKNEPVSAISLNCYTNYWGDNVIGSEYNLGGQLALIGDGNSSNNGTSWAELFFSSGEVRTNAPTEQNLRKVFKVDKNGTITPEDTTVNANVGSPTNMYSMGYFKNIVLLGDDNNKYKISVDNSGNLVATLIS